jgi:hypothetical protein
MVGEMPVELLAQLLLLLYPDRRGRPKVRIHGRPRSDRKRRFLLSAVAPSTSTRHPREARPINWAQRGGLASGGECLLTPRPHFTAPSCTLGNQVVRASDGSPFRQERRPTRLCRTPGAGSSLLAEASTLRAGRSCPGWRPGGFSARNAAAYNVVVRYGSVSSRSGVAAPSAPAVPRRSDADENRGPASQTFPSVPKGDENGPRRVLRGPSCLVAGTGFEPATSGL